MPPGTGHYRPNTGSNPYNNFHGPTPQGGFQHQNSNFHSQGFSSHPGFSSNSQNGTGSIFPNALANGSLSNSFGTGNNALGGVGSTSLASHEAQMRFAHAANVQQHLQDGIGMSAFGAKMTRTRDVWQHNLEAEMATIRDLIDRYPYVSMDTEFPSIVARPMGDFNTKADYHYQTLRCNVDLQKLIRLGITLFSPEGDLPSSQVDNSLRATYGNGLDRIPPSTWIFNFKFNIDEDMCSEDSIRMLRNSGVDLDRCAQSGIDHTLFGSVLQSSGLTTNPDAYWISFHSAYDFGYLLKMMYPKLLPRIEEEYLQFIRGQFPNIWDIKFLFKHMQHLALSNNPSPALSHQAVSILTSLHSSKKSSLQDLADELGCQREGRNQTPVLDSWLTGLVFWSLKQKIYNGEISSDLISQIWGLSQGVLPASTESQAPALTGQPRNNAANGLTALSKGDSNASAPSSGLAGTSNTSNSHGTGFGAALGAMGSGGAFGNFHYGR